MKQPSIRIFSLLMLVGLASCQSVPQPPTEMAQELDDAIASAEKVAAPAPLKTLPSSVQQELMQGEIQQARAGLLSEKRLDIAASQVNAQAFFAALVEDSPYSVAVHPEVAGSITLNLKDVTLPEAIDVIEQLYGFDIKHQGRIIQVYPAGIRTETIPLNYLFVKRFGASSTSINSGGVSENDPNNGNGSNNNNGRSGDRARRN